MSFAHGHVGSLAALKDSNCIEPSDKATLSIRSQEAPVAQRFVYERPIQAVDLLEQVIFPNFLGVDFNYVTSLQDQLHQPFVARHQLALSLERHQKCFAVLTDFKPQLGCLNDCRQHTQRIAFLQRIVATKCRQRNAHDAVNAHVLWQGIHHCLSVLLKEGGEWNCIELLVQRSAVSADIAHGLAHGVLQKICGDTLPITGLCPR